MSLFDSGVRPSIDEYLLAEAAKVRNYGLYWSASSAGYCQRKVIFERLGVPKIEKEDDGRKQRVFTSGHIFHSWIQGITKAAGLSIASEIELQDEELMVRGHFDDLVLIYEGVEMADLSTEPPGKVVKRHNLILYDYKTVNSRSFTYAKVNGSAMSYYHRLQLGTYMLIIRRLQKEEVKPTWLDSLPTLTETRILKISKDDLRMDEQQLLWSPGLESDVLSYWNSLNTHWQNKTLPPCSCADREGGFMSRPKFNPFFYDGESCSLKYYKLFKAGKL